MSRSVVVGWLLWVGMGRLLWDGRCGMSLFRRIAVEQLMCGSVAVGCYGSLLVGRHGSLWVDRCRCGMVAVGRSLWVSCCGSVAVGWLLWVGR